MTSESPKPSVATVFDPALQLSSVDRTTRIMYCPDEQVLAWFVTTSCPEHSDGEARIVDASGWQCLECGRYLGEWMFTRTEFDAALPLIISKPETILFDPLKLNAWITTVRQREREASPGRQARAAAHKAWVDGGCKGPPPVQAPPAWSVDKSPVAGSLEHLSTTAGDGGRGIRQFFSLKVLHHRWLRTLEIMGFRGRAR